jgi:hypothetical protein
MADQKEVPESEKLDKNDHKDIDNAAKKIKRSCRRCGGLQQFIGIFYQENTEKKYNQYDGQKIKNFKI